jgi:hypothetical protein
VRDTSSSLNDASGKLPKIAKLPASSGDEVAAAEVHGLDGQLVNWPRWTSSTRR